MKLNKTNSIQSISTPGQISAAKKTLRTNKLELKPDYIKTLEIIPGALFILNESWEIIYCNKKTHSVIGKKPKDITGKNIWKLVPELADSILYKKCHSIVFTKKPLRFEEYYPHIKSWLLVYLYPLNMGISVYLEDVTKLKEDAKHLHELSRQKDEFVSIASHELKTPVTSIKGYTQILHMRFAEEKNAKAVELLSRLLGQINKLTSLIDDLLDTTRIDKGKLQFHFKYFDFNELITETVEAIQQTTHSHTIITKLSLTSKIYGDRDRIGQVIINFLSNAIKYSPNATKIILTTFKERKSITLCVQDFGIGISKEKQDKVFDRFFRVSGLKEDTFPGLGLGLFISGEIIKRHKGTTSVNSIKGKGSTFCFVLPSEGKLKKNKHILGGV